MNRNTLFGRLLLIAGIATTLGSSATYIQAARASHIAPPTVPSAIQVPAGNKLFLVVHAVGTQNYTCTGLGAWGPAVPMADLFNKHWHKVGTHFAGPTWQYKDGSSVLGMKIAGATVTAGAIDWLLVKAVSTTTGPTGGHKLTPTTYIQRIHTTGGLAPSGACVSGSTASVPYTADYYFYRAICTNDDDEDDD